MVYNPERRVAIRGCVLQGMPLSRAAVRVEHVVQRNRGSGEVGGAGGGGEAMLGWLHICSMHFLFLPPHTFLYYSLSDALFLVRQRTWGD